MNADLKKLPGVEYARNNLHRWPLVRSIAVACLYPVERQLVRGRHTPKSDHPSIIHFSVNKAATQYIRNLLIACTVENGLTPVQFSQYSWMTNMNFLDRMTDEEFQDYKHVFRPRGYCYTSFARFVRNIPNSEQYRKILVTRDPRDIVTSHYFSLAFSHPLPADPKRAKEFLQQREEVRKKSIDEFVIYFSDRVIEAFNSYMDHLIGQENLHVTRYEDMVADFSSWLDALLAFCDLKISDKTRAQLIASSAGSVPAGQRPDQKRRQVVPGDHLRKLKPETIAALNERFAPILDAFGYER